METSNHGNQGRIVTMETKGGFLPDSFSWFMKVVPSSLGFQLGFLRCEQTKELE